MAYSIGKTIKRLRKERNLTQEELANQLNVTAQAISKWENEIGWPDISQIIPLASVLAVSTDVLFGIEGTTADEEAYNISSKAYAIQKYKNLDTYLLSYTELINGLKKYPNNLILLNNCMHLGLALSLPENGWLYASERAKEIKSETIRQANLIISYSKNISDMMAAHQALVLLHASDGQFDKAKSEAQNFPIRTDFTLYANIARINEYMGNYSGAIVCLCSDIDYSLQTLADNAVRLGKAYYNSGKYKEAIEVYETFFDIMKAIFKDNSPPPYHDFDSGDCYILLAQAYLAIGDNSQAVKSVEASIMYYLKLMETYGHEKIERKLLMKASLVKETEVNMNIYPSILKEKLIEKLSAEVIKPLSENKRFQKLCETVNNLKV